MAFRGWPGAEETRLFISEGHSQHSACHISNIWREMSDRHFQFIGLPTGRRSRRRIGTVAPKK